MELDEVVMKLVGPVKAVGDSVVDAERLENLQKLTKLVYRLLDEIQDASASADRVEASMRAIGKVARAFLRDVGYTAGSGE